MLGSHNATSFSVFTLPDSEPARKRVREEDDDAGEYLNGMLATLAPSAVAKSSVVCDMQNLSRERVASDRPESDTDHLPIALLYHGQFLDVASGASDGTYTRHRQAIIRI